MELDRVSSSDFRPHIGSQVVLSTSAGDRHELVIFTVRDLEKSPRPGAHRAAFTVELKGPAELRLPQQIFTFHHDALGDSEVFIVPLAPDVYGSKFELLFN
jgi:hypothetical protein